MRRKSIIIILKLLLFSILLAWISIWVLKPTELWTKKWKVAEEKASDSVFGYNGLDFAVYSFPVIALAAVGFIYLDRRRREEPINRKGRTAVDFISNNPIIINRSIGILNGAQILASSLFLVFLAWTFYVRISSDFEKMTPIKSLKLKLWEYRAYKMSVRCGLLAEACVALLLLPVLRGMSVFRLVNVQFEASVRYHVWLGTATVALSTLHGAGTMFIWGHKHRIQDEMWKWQRKGRIYLAGEIALVTALVIWITSLPQIRRKRFELFYYTHHLYVAFFVFFLFHGGDRHFYMVFPGIFLFAIDKLLRIVQSRAETFMLSARVFPCNAVELTLPKDPRLRYSPTSVIFLKVPIVSRLEWHPFSVTSSSSADEDTISLIVKREGRWTQTLYEKICAGGDFESDRRRRVRVAIEGPYGPASPDFYERYDNLLLVAGGIGITPFVSMLRELYCNSRSDDDGDAPLKIQLIYCVKNSTDVSLIDPILPQLYDVERSRLKLRVFVTRENRESSIRQVLDEMPKIETTHFDASGTCCYPTYGPEDLIWTALITMACVITFLVSLLCLSNFFVPNSKKPSEQKTPSSAIDLILICSFVVALFLGSIIAVAIRQRRTRTRKEIGSFSNEHGRALKLHALEYGSDLDRHEIHFGVRPNFRDIVSDFAAEAGESDIGVLVCGPEAMKESVSSACRSMASITTTGKKPHFSFHSLNFTL